MTAVLTAFFKYPSEVKKRADKYSPVADVSIMQHFYASVCKISQLPLSLVHDHFCLVYRLLKPPLALRFSSENPCRYKEIRLVRLKRKVPCWYEENPPGAAGSVPVRPILRCFPAKIPRGVPPKRSVAIFYPPLRISDFPGSQKSFLVDKEDIFLNSPTWRTWSRHHRHRQRRCFVFGFDI